jgi:hypothetical protein
MTTTSQSSAVELTAEEYQERVDRCFAIGERIKQGVRNQRQSLWDLAQALHEFDQENGWTALGHDKLVDWLADPEVSMTQSTFYRLVGVYRDLVIQRAVPLSTLRGLDSSKVAIVLPQIRKGKVSTQEALSDVEALGASDLRTKYVRPTSQVQSEPVSGPEEDDEPAPKPVYEPEDEPTSLGDVSVIDEEDQILAEFENQDSGTSELDRKPAQEPEPAMYRHPSQDLWDEVTATAKSRKKTVAKHVVGIRALEWELVGGNGSSREDWHLVGEVAREDWAVLACHLNEIACGGVSTISSTTAASGLAAVSYLINQAAQ